MNSLDLFNPSEEHRLLRQTVRQFVAAEVEAQAFEHDRQEKFNLPLFGKLGDLGLHGITVPEEFGGSGMDAVAAVIAHEELSYSDPGFCLAYLAHSMLCVNNLYVNGSDEQRSRYLPKLCSGEWVGAMGMSEPGAGTDVLGMKCQAVKEGEKYILNGRKMWITNGTTDGANTPADCVLVYCKTGPIDERGNLSTFIVERDFSGFTVGQKIGDKLGVRASNTAELCFDNCEVPVQNLLGVEGDSLEHMMRNLEIERIALAAMGLGIAMRALHVMVKYAEERVAFGKKIGEFGQIQAYIANSYAEFQAARSYVYRTASGLNLKEGRFRLDSDGAKIIATRAAKAIADRAIQVLGGYGYVGEYVVERLWRDAKLLEIGGGTVESHQKNMTRDLLRNPDTLRG